MSGELARFVIEGRPVFKYEDSGCAAIGEVDDEPTGWFVRLQSWSDAANARPDGGVLSDEQALAFHPIVQALNGRRVRVTIEALPEASEQLDGGLDEAEHDGDGAERHAGQQQRSDADPGGV
jgi:hypothetical protein